MAAAILASSQPACKYPAALHICLSAAPRPEAAVVVTDPWAGVRPCLPAGYGSGYETGGGMQVYGSSCPAVGSVQLQWPSPAVQKLDTLSGQHMLTPLYPLELVPSSAKSKTCALALGVPHHLPTGRTPLSTLQFGLNYFGSSSLLPSHGASSHRSRIQQLLFRPHTAACELPNGVLTHIPGSPGGCSVVALSHSGSWMAAACADADGHFRVRATHMLGYACRRACHRGGIYFHVCCIATSPASQSF